MKVTKTLKYSLLICFLALSQMSWGGSRYERRKIIEKSYPVNKSTLLDINNKFGFVQINSWAKNDFSFKIEITGKGKTEERAQRILDEISIEFDSGNSIVYVKTIIENMKNKNDEGFEVNYTVSMPDANPLRVKNRFGDVTMGDRDNDLALDVSYGSFRAGDVKGDTELYLAFGNGDIGDIQDGDLDIKYSKIDIGSGQKIDMAQRFSDIELEEVADLVLESKYGDIKIGKAESIDVEVKYSGFEIEELTGKLEMTGSYVGNFKINKLAHSFTLVDIRGKYSSYTIGLEEGLNANIEAEFNYADLKSYADVNIDFQYRVKDQNRSVYKGKIGSGDSNRLIKIESSYGSLRFR